MNIDFTQLSDGVVVLARGVVNTCGQEVVVGAGAEPVCLLGLRGSSVHAEVYLAHLTAEQKQAFKNQVDAATTSDEGFKVEQAATEANHKAIGHITDAEEGSSLG